MSQNVHDFVGSTFNMKVIKGLAEKEISLGNSKEPVYLLDIVSGSYGNFQKEEIANFFNLDNTEIEDEDDVFGNQFIVDVEKYLTDSINLNGYFFFNYLEADNSFGLYFKEKE